MTGVGTDVLFENHTVKEIQEIEKKLRNDIERKKEELRQMVGERYRDLMEAADTITEMKQIAQNVTKSVKSIESRCTSLQKSSLQNGVLFAIQDKISERKRSKESLNTLAAQIKILMDSPTKIWSSMESKNFSDSVCLYLLAKHVHSLLVLGKDAGSQFPVINRQWASISQFRSVLLENSQKVLESQEAEPEDVLEPVCCLCLLTNSSVQKLFVEFLKTRQNVIKNIFQDDKAAKDQVCEFVNVVQMTLKIIYVLFYSVSDNFNNNGLEKNLLYHALSKLLNAKEPGPVSLMDLKSSEIFKFLPSDVRDFRPTLNCGLDACTVEFLQTKCISWLDEIKTNLHGDLGTLLNFVKSVKNLSHIRESLFEKFTEVKVWDMICNDLLGKSFSIWDFFLRECFLQRIQDIINEGALKASELCQRDIESMLSNIGSDATTSPRSKVERNLPLYVWSESAQDVVSSVAWLPRHHRHYWDSGELSMKSMGFTPRVQSLCKELDGGVRQMLEDVASFIRPWDRQATVVIEERIAEGTKQEAATIHGYTSCAVDQRFLDLLNFIEAHLTYLEAEKDSTENSSRIVFLGHVCNGLANLCPHINVALSEKTTERNVRLKPTATAVKESEKWKVLKSKLLETSANAFRLWSRSQLSTLRSSVERELTTDSVEGVLKILLQWDRIEIQEESEQGNAVHSILRIPQQVSTPVANALFTFCCQLNAIGGFSINSEVRSSISRQLLQSLLAVYREKTDSRKDEFQSMGGLLQVQSLQLLFDVHFLTGLMAHKEATAEEVIAKCVSHIDPFDMDVFAQPLQQNVKRALQKSLSLYGLIASPDQVSYLNSCRSLSQGGGQMDHNVILMSPSLSRFPHLPLPTKSTPASSSQEQLPLQPKEEEVKNIHSHSSSPNLVAIDTNPLKSTASFYEKVTAMSSSWFGN